MNFISIGEPELQQEDLSSIQSIDTQLNFHKTLLFSNNLL